MIDKLMKLGFKTNESKVLSVLLDDKEYATRDIEKLTDLRQPEVSIALKQLTERELVSFREVKIKKGRPYKIISLSQSPYITCLDLIKEIGKEYNEKIVIIESLIDMTSAEKPKSDSA